MEVHGVGVCYDCCASEFLVSQRLLGLSRGRAMEY